MDAFKNLPMHERVMYVIAAVTLVVIALFAPNANAQSGHVYGNGQAQTVSPAEEGVVLQVNTRRVEPSWQARTVGATIGGVFGGLVANSVDYRAQAAVNMLGAAIGGVVGERVANATMSNDANEIVVAVKDPRTGSFSRVITIVQPHPSDEFFQNDQVLVVNTGGAARVIKRNYN